jgi:hypothetical protein
MRFRIYYHSYADVEANSPEEALNIDTSEQIMKYLMACQVRLRDNDQII